MENTIKNNLLNAYKTNNYIGQIVHKMELVKFLVKKSKSIVENKIQDLLVS
jgi:hypothetical protein